jgi:uncharacterized protein DUF6800
VDLNSIALPPDLLKTEGRSSNVPCSERRKEIKRRRHRRKKLTHLAKRLEKATVSEKATIADKVRALTPGSDTIVSNWDLKER